MKLPLQIFSQNFYTNSDLDEWDKHLMWVFSLPTIMNFWGSYILLSISLYRHSAIIARAMNKTLHYKTGRTCPDACKHVMLVCEPLSGHTSIYQYRVCTEFKKE